MCEEVNTPMSINIHGISIKFTTFAGVAFFQIAHNVTTTTIKLITTQTKEIINHLKEFFDFENIANKNPAKIFDTENRCTQFISLCSYIFEVHTGDHLLICCESQ